MNDEELKNGIIQFVSTYVERRNNNDTRTGVPDTIFEDNKYDNLTVKASYGNGSFANVPWIGFLGYGQEITNGIYPALLYYYGNNKLIVSYCVSNTNNPDYNQWELPDDKMNVCDYFGVGRNQIKYPDSFIENAFDVTIDNGDVTFYDGGIDAVVASLRIVCNKFHNLFSGTIDNGPKTALDYAIRLTEKASNIILQGAPGTGKTYNASRVALSYLGYNIKELEENEIQSKYKEELYCPMSDNVEENKEGRLFFTTFHQSMDYEDFIEGYKPKVIDGKMEYCVEKGIFKLAVERALKDPKKKVVLIIDEINRGNVSKIFGELISLIENDKRLGSSNELTAMLPYSKTLFSVPKNLLILGTMNTTDRSTGSLDYALRRRFSFLSMPADVGVAQSLASDVNVKGDIKRLFENVKNFIVDNNTSDMPIDDLMIGHSYFMVTSKDDLKDKWTYEILPLLLEYYKDGIIKKSPLEEINGTDPDLLFDNWTQQS